MSLPSSWRRWLHLPSRIALLLGVGALSASAAKAAIVEPHLGDGPLRGPQQSAKSFGEVLVWSDKSRIYFSEGGHDAQELRLGDTPEARHLRQLLARDGATVNSPRILPHRMILVGGGGSAIYWGGAQPASKPDRAAHPPAAGSADAGAAPPTKPSGQPGKRDRTSIVGADRPH